MSRCTVLGGIILLSVAVALVVGVVAQSAGASNAQWPHAVFGHSPKSAAAPTPFRGAHVIVLRLTDVTTTYVDNAPSGTSVGDELTGEGTLVTLRGHSHGRLDFHEALTGLGPEPNSGRLQVTAIARLPHGDIDVSGVVGIAQAHDPVLAITGGTQRYHAARGQVIAHAGPHRTRLTFWITS
jgi:hypothetical protein